MKLHRSPAAEVYFNGQRLECTDFTVEYRVAEPARVTVTGFLDGILTLESPPPPPPREDIVQHLGTRCCCRHCPEGGDHA